MKWWKIWNYWKWLSRFICDTNQLLEIEVLDSISARVRSHGLVGYESDDIYSHLIHKISRLLQPSYSRFSAGLDYGFKDDTMACILLGFDYNFKFVNVIDCLKIENKLVRYDNKQLARLVVKFYIKLAKENNLLYEYDLTEYIVIFQIIHLLNKRELKKLNKTSFRFRELGNI